MTARFSERLRNEADSIWDAQLCHPFVQGLGDGSLDVGCFKRWVCQDYLFLVDYARLFGLATARATDLDVMRWLADRVDGVLHHELLLHEAYAVEFGIPHEELLQGVKLPTTRAYTDHLLRTASLGSLLELLAGMLPCLWGYTEIGRRLAEQNGSSDSRYFRWINMYSGPVAGDLAARGRYLLDAMAESAGSKHLSQAKEAFLLSSRYEWMFWQMCYRGESWPI